MRKNKLLGIILLVIGLSAPSFVSADVTLSVPERFQEYSNWCWAGSSEAILNYNGLTPSQCEIANYCWSSTRCCGNYTFYQSVKGCNKGAYIIGDKFSIEDIMDHWGISTTGYYDYISWTSCVSELDSGDPFVIRFGWSGGGGHFLVGYGYITTGQYLKYMDPWPGEGYTTSTYSFVVSSTDHDWTHTLTTD